MSMCKRIIFMNGTKVLLLILLLIVLKDAKIKEYAEPSYSYYLHNDDLNLFNKRYYFDSWNLWEQIAYLNRVHRSNDERKTSLKEFELSKFIKSMNKNLVPFYFSKINKIKILESGDVIINED